MAIDRMLSMIGLATKAGKVASGEFSTERAIKSHKATMVIVANDASDNTKKKFTDMCSWYKVPIIFAGTKESIGKAMGKEIRASFALLDSGFADMIQKLAHDAKSN